MSEAAILAVEQLSLEALRGRDVYVDTSYFASNEQPFILGEFRARCLREGVQMTSVRDEAQVIVEVRSGGVGIDRKDFLFGIPALLLTAGGDDNVASRVPILTPEIAFVKNIEQKGFASIAFVAFWAQTGEVISSSGPFIGRTLRDDWWFFGFGPQTVGNIPPVEKADQ